MNSKHLCTLLMFHPVLCVFNANQTKIEKDREWKRRDVIQLSGWHVSNTCMYEVKAISRASWSWRCVFFSHFVLSAVFFAFGVDDRQHTHTHTAWEMVCIHMDSNDWSCSRVCLCVCVWAHTLISYAWNAFIWMKAEKIAEFPSGTASIATGFNLLHFSFACHATSQWISKRNECTYISFVFARRFANIV